MKQLFDAIHAEDERAFDNALEAVAHSIDTPLEGVTALAAAASCNSGYFVKALLDKGADPNAPTLMDQSASGTALLEAARFQKLEAVKQLVRSGAQVNASRDSDGHTAIWMCPNPEITEFLLEAGADISLVDKEGSSILHCCQARSIPLLIKAGADIEAKDKEGQTPLIRYKMFEASVEALLDAGADVSACDNLGNTAAHRYINYHGVEALKLLLKSGADVNARNHEGETPLHFVLDIVQWHDGYSHDASALNLLLDAGADPTIKNAKGQDAFDLAQELYRDRDDDPDKNDPDYPSDAFWNAGRDQVLKALKKKRKPPTPALFEINRAPSHAVPMQQVHFVVDLPGRMLSEFVLELPHEAIVLLTITKKQGWQGRSEDGAELVLRLDSGLWIGGASLEAGGRYVASIGGGWFSKYRVRFTVPSDGGLERFEVRLPR